LTAKGFRVDVVDGSCAYQANGDSYDLISYDSEPAAQNHIHLQYRDPFKALCRSSLAGPVFIVCQFPDSVVSHLEKVFRQKRCATDEAINNSYAKPASSLGFEGSGNSANDPFVQWYGRNRDFMFGGKTIRAWSQEMPTPAHGNTSIASPMVSRTLSRSRMVAEQPKPHGGLQEEPGVIQACDIEFFDTSFTIAHGKRKLVTTIDGRVGMVPAWAHAEDVVCVLPGGRMPLILRKQKEHYILIGESYTHGIMFGEAMIGLERG